MRTPTDPFFSSTKTGALNIAYSFGSAPDGANPTSTLISVGGVLYGTTLGGGGTSCNSGQGCGTVFSIDASGTETVLYRFQGGSDGQTPSSKLTYYQGTLYGTTFFRRRLRLQFPRLRNGVRALAERKHPHRV